MNIDGVPVLVQHQGDPAKWVLVKDFFYWRGESLQHIPAGFVTDFASIPRLFWNIVAPTELGDTGPIKHDWHYRNGIGTRAEADEEFLDDMTADRITFWKRYACYYLVRLFGGRSWDSGAVELVTIEGEL